MTTKLAAPPAVHRCSECGYAAPKWFGRCPDCGAWSSAVPATSGRPPAEVRTLSTSGAPPHRLGSGMGEVDRVLGGGLVPGSAVLLAGEPGIGKSTLVLQLMGSLAEAGQKVLLVTGEESVDQVGLRARRLALRPDDLYVVESGSLQTAVAAFEAEAPRLLVVDSIQALQDGSLEQAGGSVVQVRECAAALTRLAKATGTIVLLVGHITKEGTVAGPKTLEHLVDVVLVLEGERSGALRLLRTDKNRFGSCEETGVFLMGGRGLETVEDPSAMLLADRRPGISGSVIFPALEGTRPVLTEIQALVYETKSPQPRRVAIGLDARRLALSLGILAKRVGRAFQDKDVFVASAGGLAVRETGADLPLCLALLSALRDQPLSAEVVAVGELGLGGEVRRVPAVDRRVTEAARLGYHKALVPRGPVRASAGLEIVGVADVHSAYAHARRVDTKL